MSHIERSIVLPFTRQQLFNLVTDIIRYPEFVPYCLDAKILKEDGSHIEGTLRAGYKGLGYNFATQNTHHAPEHIRMQLLSGPFQRLEGDWFFDETEHGTHVRLKLTIIFKNPVLSMLFKHKIDDLTDMVVKAFIDRARAIY